MIRETEIRRSIRKYRNQTVEEEKILQMLESARLAPSGSNTQPWHFILVKSDETRKKLAEKSHNQSWMVSAPVFIVCVADIRSRIKEEERLELDENSPQHELKQIIRDTAIATEHIVLTAESLDLGTCWVAHFTQEDIRPVLNIPSDKYVLSIITVGYPDEEPEARPRKRLEDMLHSEAW
jgi:nitroreductase